MPTVDINYLAVLVAAATSVAIGAVWYSRLLFGKQWSRFAGKNMYGLRTGANLGYAVVAAGALVQAYILAHFVQYATATTLAEGAATGFWLWVGFVAVTSAFNSMFAGRPLGLWRIDSGYFLVALLINGALLAVWR